jgi:hypothetical protein
VELDDGAQFIDGIELYAPIVVLDICEGFVEFSPGVVERFEVLAFDVDDVAFADGAFYWGLVGFVFGVAGVFCFL